MTRRSLPVTLLFSVAALARSARADEPRSPAVVAQALYDDAMARMDIHDFAGACPRLEQAVKLLPAAVGARLALGTCYEGSGRLLRAHAAYVAAGEAAALSGQKSRQEQAEARAAGLASQVPRLVVVVPQGVKALPGLTILRDGVLLDASAWGVPAPVDLGTHTITVTANGKRRGDTTVEVQARGAVVRAVVEMPDDIAASPLPEPPPPLSREARQQRDRLAARARTHHVIAYSVGSAGVAGVLTGGILAGIAASKKQTIAAHCTSIAPGSFLCDTAGKGAADTARGLATAGTVALATGVTALAGAPVIFFTAPSAPEGRAAALSVRPFGAGIEIVGAW